MVHHFLEKFICDKVQLWYLNKAKLSLVCYTYGDLSEVATHGGLTIVPEKKVGNFQRKK